MTVRRAKQVIYGAFYLIVICAIILFFWHFWSNNPANNGTVATPCAAGCVTTSTDGIVIGDSSFFESAPDSYTYVARIENHNQGFAARTFEYQLNIGSQAIPGGSFLYDGEVKYIVFPNISAQSSGVSPKLEIMDVDWVPAAEMGSAPQFKIMTTGSGSSNNLFTVNGTITDDDPSAFTNVILVAIFRGSNGADLGASSGELDSISPGETEQFSISYPDVQGIDSGNTEVYAYALRK